VFVEVVGIGQGARDQAASAAGATTAA
jgi:hypothetical protein